MGGSGLTQELFSVGTLMDGNDVLLEYMFIYNAENARMVQEM
jgi:hypothetical protein